MRKKQPRPMTITGKHHPAALWVSAFCYAMVTFAFADLASLLVLYLTHATHMSSHTAYVLYGAFNALLFTYSIAGGYFSERLGYKDIALIGIIVCIIGGFIMGLGYNLTAYIGIAIFIVGFGLATASFYSMVGLAYSTEDPRRQSAYTIFYLLFNCGTILGVALSGFVASHFGYTHAFGLVAWVDVLALIGFVLFVRYLKPYPGNSFARQVNVKHWVVFPYAVALVVLSSAACYVLLVYPFYTNTLTWLLVIVVGCWVVYMANQQRHAIARKKLYLLAILCLIASAYWAIFMLENSLVTIFIDGSVDRTLLGVTIPASVFFALDPLYVILLGLVLSWLWHFLAKRKRNPSIPLKFASSMLFTGVGCAVLVAAIVFFQDSRHLISAWWIVLAYFFFTMGELFIAPIGMSMIGQLSPKGKEGSLMGVWTLCISFGAVLSVYLDKLAQVPKHATAAAAAPIYQKGFTSIAALLLVVGFILLAFVPKMERLITHTRRDSDI